MKETRNTKLPIIGRVQHGEQLMVNGKRQVKDYGYFIAKIREDNMKHYLNEFDRIIKGSKSIDIQFFDDNPLRIRNERNNQSGTVCYCMENETIGRQKVKNLWKPIECTENCQYLQKDSYGKKACNRIAWLKFFIPAISKDRLWLMRITGQESIENLKCYLMTQKSQGNTLNGIYTIFLTQKEQVDFQGKIHNNYILDIVQKNTVSQAASAEVNQPIQKTIISEAKPKETAKGPEIEQSAEQNNSVTQTTTAVSKNKTTAKETKKTATKQTTAKQQTPDNSKKAESIEKGTENSSKSISNSSSNDLKETTGDYALISTSEEIIKTAKGEKKYVVGEFADLDDKMHNIYIKPEFASELQQCDIGTMVKLTVQEKADKKFAMDILYITKLLKKEVA